jgi:hypothetical protein
VDIGVLAPEPDVHSESRRIFLDLRTKPVNRLLLVLVMVGCSSEGSSTGEQPSTPPAEVPSAWLPLVGEYASGSDTVSILEDEGDLVLLRWHGEPHPMTALSDSTFAVEGGEARQR